ncbi:AAA family ATPase [Orrella marina]|nr:AAA family ATPase [Orrella marina]
MDENDFLNALTQVTNKRKPALATEEAPSRPPMPKLPFNNFWGNRMLALIYLSPHRLPAEIESIRHALNIAIDEAQAPSDRAQAALTIGNFVNSHEVAIPLDEEGHTTFTLAIDGENEWFRLSGDLGNPVGSLLHANSLLQERNLKVECNVESDPMPRLVSTDGKEPRYLHGPVVEEWLNAIRMIAAAAQEQFASWSPLEFRSCLAAIANYLSIVPEFRQLGRSKIGSQKTTGEWEKRFDDLNWIKPLWDGLLDAMPSKLTQHRCAGVDKELRALRTQQYVVISRLQREAGCNSASTSETQFKQGSVSESARRQEQDRLEASWSSVVDQLVVVTSPIAVSNDREDRVILEQYEKLRRPLPFAELPSLDQIQSIWQQLLTEFPWATEAVTTIMSDLMARKLHGARRLGMMPILLVGVPGCGKTRFAQRMGDLLQSPSLVLNLAGMSDVKTLKGVTRGWASARPSRIVEFILQTSVPNPIVLLDEVDKTGRLGTGGDPQEALLDLLEPGNAARYQDIYLMASCDLSHCLYILTSNSLARLSAPLKSRLRPVYFPKPGPEHAPILIQGVTRDLEKAWNLPKGTITLTPAEREILEGLSPREMRFAVTDLLGNPAIKSGEKLH